MLVIDASAVVEILMVTPRGHAIEEYVFGSGEPLAAPHLIDVEVLHVFRRFHRQRLLTTERCKQALEDLADFPITRYGHLLLHPAIWRLRDHLTAYDAAYVALAELLDAPIVTCDGKLARSTGHNVSFQLFDPRAS